MNLQEMLDIIKQTNTDIHIDTVKSFTNGWDNDILLVNDEVVFRFPKTKETASKVMAEAALIKQLILKRPLLLVPEYEMVLHDGNFIGVKYDYITGDSGLQPSFNRRNARLIGDFLTKLHTIDPSAIKDTNIRPVHNKKYWEELNDSVETYIFPHISPTEKTAVQNLFSNFFSDSIFSTHQRVAIHGDLTTANMIFNKETGLVKGIIDFTDAQVGDPAFDFAGLYWALGPVFTMEVLSHYHSEDKEAIFNRVQNFYGLQPVFHELIYAIKSQQSVNWNTALNRFLKLLPEELN
ncbi:aminoglycoside phosphotransferase family protein [Bacillus salacetis]|uniref:Aminoglycoside phosphotransferase family protein n=1 Tax=Bacillus salacetis TaxID=2315464 RepID=A0A3A1QSM3_9BACI|nr:aminoglycoside phosphotransferase family protein [Bacillus salacetis]RIW30383.1 aminoglycoside phosphotransferase family protein [Bacillus salacetis]